MCAGFGRGQTGPVGAQCLLSQKAASSAPEAGWEGGGWKSTPPSPPTVTGAITLLAADGYQLARASLSISPPSSTQLLSHLSQGAAFRRSGRRPAASGDFPELLALGEPLLSLGRGRRTVHVVLATTDSLGNDFASGERAVQSFSKALQQPSSSPPISQVPPAPRVLP